MPCRVSHDPRIVRVVAFHIPLHVPGILNIAARAATPAEFTGFDRDSSSTSRRADPLCGVLISVRNPVRRNMVKRAARGDDDRSHELQASPGENIA